MKIYVNEEVKECKNNGIFEEHFAGFVKTAKEENVIIIVRPVNPITKILLPQKYPTKHFSIKNKSSDWGIQSGFIISLTELTFLSKIGLKNNETQVEIITTLCKKFSIKLDKNNQNNNKINSDSLQLTKNETILKITGEHFSKLLLLEKSIGIIDLYFSLENTIFVQCLQPKNKKNEIILYLEKEKNNNIFKVYYIFALDNENKVKNLNNRNLKEIIKTEKNNLIYFPIPVFCKEINQEKKPLIPDYDLFAVCWIIDDSIKYYQPPIPTNSFAAVKINSWLINRKERDFHKIFKKPHSRAKGLNFEQDQEIGNAIKRGKTEIFLDKLNRNLGYEKGFNDELRPIHHAFELVNPVSKGFNENFYIIFLPNNRELLIDFKFPEKVIIDKDKKNISYFAIYEPLCLKNYLWKIFLEPFLIYIQAKGYYVPNNCFVKESDFLGFINSSNHWVKKIREDKISRWVFNHWRLYSKSKLSENFKTEIENSEKIKKTNEISRNSTTQNKWRTGKNQL